MTVTEYTMTQNKESPTMSYLPVGEVAMINTDLTSPYSYQTAFSQYKVWHTLNWKNNSQSFFL